MDVEPVEEKRAAQYYQPTTFQFLIAICLLAAALFASWEIARLPGF
jgi:hypothetical protein